MDNNNAGEYTIVKAYADWCGPCRIYNKSFRKVMQRHDLTYDDLNVDNDTEKATRYDIHALPTTIIFKDGEEVARATGALVESKLESFLSSWGVV